MEIATTQEGVNAAFSLARNLWFAILVVTTAAFFALAVVTTITGRSKNK